MLLYVLLVFSLIAYARNQSFYISPVRLTNNCKENEVFTNCGSACDLTCENVTSPARKTNSYEPYVVLDEPPCKPQYNCIPGCYCRKPLYRNRFGDCVEEKECKRNFNRHDFVEELNKFLGSFTFDEHRQNVRQPPNTDTEKTGEPQSNQKYIAVNDNSESVINPRTGYQSSQTSGYQSTTGYPNLFGFNEREFFGNLFDDLFSQARHSPKQQPNYRQTNYNYNNYNTANGGSIQAKDASVVDVDRELEKQIEKEADIIIQQISNGLKIKRFIVETLRSLVGRSQYSSLASTVDDPKDSKNGLITTK